jgi:hypothetical protein
MPAGDRLRKACNRSLPPKYVLIDNTFTTDSSSVSYLKLYYLPLQTSVPSGDYLTYLNRWRNLDSGYLLACRIAGPYHFWLSGSQGAGPCVLDSLSGATLFFKMALETFRWSIAVLKF